MTEKTPDAASKLACPEEEIPMGMTPWSQLDEEARARVSRPAPADGQKSPAPGTASVAPEPAPAPQAEAPIPMPATEAVQPEEAPAAPEAPVAAPVESPAAAPSPTSEAPLSMEAGEAPAAPAEAAQSVPATEPAVTAEEKADGSEAPAEDIAADAVAAAAMAEAPRSGRRGLATMQPTAMDGQIPAAEAAPLPEEGQAPAPQAEAPAAPAAPAAAPVAVLEAGPAQKVFAVLAKMGPLALLLLLACQLWPTFLTGGLYCPPEMKLMDTVREALASGQWFAPLHNGDAQLPVFVWMLAALDLVARMVPQLSAFVWPAGAALGGLACLWGTWALSRAAGFGPQAALASGLILLSSLLFPQLAHFMGPQGLACGLCLLSMAFFCMGWKKEHAWISLPLAFLRSGRADRRPGLPDPAPADQPRPPVLDLAHPPRPASGRAGGLPPAPAAGYPLGRRHHLLGAGRRLRPGRVGQVHQPALAPARLLVAGPGAGRARPPALALRGHRRQLGPRVRHQLEDPAGQPQGKQRQLLPLDRPVLLPAPVPAGLRPCRCHARALPAGHPAGPRPGPHGQPGQQVLLSGHRPALPACGHAAGRPALPRGAGMAPHVHLAGHPPAV